MVNGLLIFVAWLVTAAANYFAFVPERAGSPLTIALILLAPTPLAIFAAVRAHRDGVLQEWLAPRMGDPTKGILLAALTYGMGTLVAQLLFAPNSDRGILLARLYLQLGDPGALRRATLASTMTLIAYALVYELVFRGLVTSLFSELIGSRRGYLAGILVALVALVPSMWSLRVGPMLNPVLVVLFGLSTIFSGLAQRFGGGRLFFIVLGHALFLWSAILLFPFWATH